MNPIRLTLVIGALAAVGSAQDRPLYIKNARIVPIEGAVIESGSVLVQSGKITSVGKDVEAPAGAHVVDAKGGTLMPGLVSAYFRIGQQRAPGPQMQQGNRGRRGPQVPTGPAPDLGAPANKAATKVVQSVYAKEEVFGDLLRCGVTTLALAPSGPGFGGLGAILDPAGRTLETLTLHDSAFVHVSPQNNTRSKELTKGELEKARKMLDDKKRPAPASQPNAPAASQPATPPASPPQSQPQPAADKNVEVLADLLDGKSRAFVELDSAAEVLHFLDALGEVRFPMVAVSHRGSATEGRVDMVLDKFKALKAPLLMSPVLVTAPLTRDLVNPAATLAAGGVEVGFLVGDTKEQARAIFFRLIELVRTGLARDIALAGVTLVPAKMLAIETRKGSIKAGKDADLLLFSGDPLDPASRLTSVWHLGKLVEKEGKQ